MSQTTCGVLETQLLLNQQATVRKETQWDNWHEFER